MPDDIRTTNTTTSFTAPAHGAPFEDGFYAGLITAAPRPYAIILPPKSEGLLRAQWAVDRAWTKDIPGAQSLWDGRANTEAMADEDHPAALWALGLRIAGHDDYYLLARDELEVCYRNLKPGTGKNYTYSNRAEAWGVDPGDYNGIDTNGNGHNASSGPVGEAYTSDSPSQTLAELFQRGGPEAFDEAGHWSSTQFSPFFAWAQTFGDGNQFCDTKYYRLSFRVARKIFI